MLTWLIRGATRSPPSAYDPRSVRVGEEHRMSEVVVVGSFTALPGKEAEAVEAFEALVAPTHAEDGCILYALHRGTDDPARLAFVERWASREHLDAHLKSPHVASLLEK